MVSSVSGRNQVGAYSKRLELQIRYKYNTQVTYKYNINTIMVDTIYIRFMVDSSTKHKKLKTGPPFKQKSKPPRMSSKHQNVPKTTPNKNQKLQKLKPLKSLQKTKFYTTCKYQSF